MQVFGQQKIDAPSFWVMAVLILATAAVSIAMPSLMPYSFLGLFALIGLLYWAIRWDVTLLSWIWMLTYGGLNWPNWILEVTGFFNMTVPRFLFLAVVLAYGMHFLFHGIYPRMDRALLWVMLALLAYLAVSMSFTGWLAQTKEVESAPYFRFLGALVFPFVMCFLIYNAVRSERQIHLPLVLLVLYGWYALYIGYLQYAALWGVGGARSLIWPAYINDPTYGIHFDRARGAFGAAGTQSVLMVALFYIDLFLIRRTTGLFRASLIVQAILCPPALFFTGIRAGYVAFGLCGVVWCLWAGRGRLGAAKLTAAALALGIVVFAYWANVSSEERRTGGVAQVGPVMSRYALLQQSLRLVAQEPLTGVGFGRFVDASRKLPRDPTGLSARSSVVLVEHNLFLNMWVETGPAGLLLTVLLFVLAFRQSLQLYHRLPGTARGDLCRDFVILYWVVMVNFLTAAMFRDTLWDVFANALFWSFTGLVVGFNRWLEPAAFDRTGRPPAAG